MAPSGIESVMGKGSREGRLALAICALAAVAGLALGLAHRQAGEQVVPVAVERVRSEASTVEVHVSGWVADPGVVSVPAGSLVVDAIVAAGGLRPGARVEAINLAAAVSQGQQVVVPGPVEGNGSHNGAPAAGPGGLSLNRATASELESLPGVGPVLAGRIVAYREANGPFSTVEDLLSVPGIGEAKLASIRDLVTVP